jgi:hypothetical protein
VYPLLGKTKEVIDMRTKLFSLRILVVVILLATVGLMTASAAAYTASPPVLASAVVSPFAGCTDDAGQQGAFSANSEVEPWVEVNPTNPDNIVASWQQDRWNNGGSRGLVAGVSNDGGASWQQVVVPGLSTCAGHPFYNRASDPWHSFSPDGSLHLMSLSTSTGITAAGFPDSAMLVSKSEDGGLTWGAPVSLIADSGPNILNDKNTITADPNDSDFVYAVWDRLVIGAGQAPPVQVFQHAVGYHGPTWFARTTDGGDTWEAARKIFDPGGVNQTIGNLITVLPQAKGGDLLDFFNLIYNFKNAKGVRGMNVAYIRSTDKGETWSGVNIVDKFFRAPVRDPETGAPVRTGDINPDVAVDPNNGNLYIAWQDGRFANKADIAFTMSTDGGASWSPTIKVTSNSGNAQAFTPSVHVASDGTVGISLYDFRNDVFDDTALSTDVWLLHCHANCATTTSWTDETRVTPNSFDMRAAPQAGGFFVGDYIGLTSSGDDFASLFVSSPGAAPSADAFFSLVGAP